MKEPAPEATAFALGAHAPGATPIDADEAADLLLPTVRTQADLNAAEQENILAAQAWALRSRRRHTVTTVLSVPFLTALHARMFGDVWRWAGTYRKSDKNLGVPWPHVRTALYECVANAQAWVEYGTFPPDERAVRWHHALVVVHPFANGNGRWARLATDALLHAERRLPFTWGGSGLTTAGPTRTAYLAALRAADHHEIGPLLALARAG